MKTLLVCALLLFPAAVLAQTAESPPAAVQTPMETETAPAINTPAERPRPAVKPAPKPRPMVGTQEPEAPVKPAPVAAAKPDEPEKPRAPVAPTGETSPASTSFGCWGLAFAMLIVGFAAGYFWRHQMSRRKLGGMSVRIGTWRGIP